MENSLKIDEILRTEHFKNFYETATEFCDFIEKVRTYSTIEFLEGTRLRLVILYHKGLELQWVDLQSNVDYEDKLITTSFNNILDSIAEKINDKRYYWHVFDPSDPDDIEPVCGDLVDDIGDIYKDLKFSIMTFNLKEADCQENAIWQFKFDYDTHWGSHCINALNAIHFLVK